MDRCPACKFSLQEPSLRCPKCGFLFEHIGASDPGVDRQRIYEEEKAKLEATEKIKQERAQGDLKRGFKGCLWIIGIFFILAIVGALFSGKAGEKRASERKINAAVRFTGTQFVITNNDSFDWAGVTMEINSGLFAGGFVLEHPRLVARQHYTVGALQFAKSDGTRFNPFAMKVQRFRITCETPHGLGFWTGHFD